jgi:uncharacterized protein
MQFEIRHDEPSRRYTAQADGQEVGLLTYFPVSEGVIDFTHTYVPPEHRGQGIAEQLVEHALDETLQRGLRFRASCWYVDAYVRRHTRYQQGFASA